VNHAGEEITGQRPVAQIPLGQFGDGFAKVFDQKVGKEALSANQGFFAINS